jgi:hypothetical protein
MSGIDIEPGAIWPARNLTADRLEQQWVSEMHHQANNLNLESLAFMESDWKEWEWHANLALEVNHQWSKAPLWFQNLIISQMEVNQHLLVGFSKLLAAWNQWEDLSRLKQIDWQPPNGISYQFLSAKTKLDIARTKNDSLHFNKKAFQIVSVRQYRFLQHLAGLLKDMEPALEAATHHAKEAIPERGEIDLVGANALWHSREAYRLVRYFEQTPAFIERVKAPRVQINRMLGIACLSHCQFLKAIIKSIQE